MINKKYLNKIGTTYLQIFVQIIIPLLLLPYMVTKLEKDLYGIWILFSTIIGYFGLTSFGFGTTFLKEVSKNTNYEFISKYLSSTLFFYISILSITIVAFVYILINLETIFVIPSDLLFEAKLSFSIFFIVFVVNFISSLFGILLFAQGMLHIQNYISIVCSILSAFFMYLVLYYGYMLISLAFINLFMSVVSAVATYYISKNKIKFTVSLKYFDRDILKKMLKPSMHYFIITASAMIILSSDNIVISSFVGVGTLAIYAIGYKLISVSQTLLFKIVDVMIPDISLLYEEGKYKEILKLHNKTLFVSILIAIFGYGILFVYGTNILEWWVGSKYVIDENILKLMITFGLLHAGIHVSAIFIVAIGLHQETAYMTMLDALLNVVFSLILIEHFGLLGVALGTLLAHLITSAWFTPWWFYKQINIKINESSNFHKKEVAI